MCPRCGNGGTALHPEDATVPCRVCGWLQDEPGAGCPPSRDMIRRAERDAADHAERMRVAEVRQLRARLHELER